MNDLIEQIVRQLVAAGVVVNFGPINVAVNVNQALEGEPTNFDELSFWPTEFDYCGCDQCNGEQEHPGQVDFTDLEEYGPRNPCDDLECWYCWPELKPEVVQDLLSREEAEELPTPSQVLELFGGNAVGRDGADEDMTASELAHILNVSLAPPQQIPLEEAEIDSPSVLMTSGADLPEWAEPIPALKADDNGVIHLPPGVDPGFFL